MTEKIRRIGHGFQNFENYRLRLLLHSGVQWETRPPPSDGGPGSDTCTRTCSARPSSWPPSFDAGVPLRDVQLAVRHADPRATTVYENRRQGLDRHAAYVVVAFVSGA